MYYSAIRNILCILIGAQKPRGLICAYNPFCFSKTYNCMHILNFIPRAKDFYFLYYTVPFTLKYLRPWEVCSLNFPGPSQPPTPSRILKIDVLGSHRSTTL